MLRVHGVSEESEHDFYKSHQTTKDPPTRPKNRVSTSVRMEHITHTNNMLGNYRQPHKVSDSPLLGLISAVYSMQHILLAELHSGSIKTYSHKDKAYIASMHTNTHTNTYMRTWYIHMCMHMHTHCFHFPFTDVSSFLIPLLLYLSAICTWQRIVTN